MTHTSPACMPRMTQDGVWTWCGIFPISLPRCPRLAYARAAYPALPRPPPRHIPPRLSTTCLHACKLPTAYSALLPLYISVEPLFVLPYRLPFGGGRLLRRAPLLHFRIHQPAGHSGHATWARAVGPWRLHLANSVRACALSRSTASLGAFAGWGFPLPLSLASLAILPGGDGGAWRWQTPTTRVNLRAR